MFRVPIRTLCVFIRDRYLLLGLIVIKVNTGTVTLLIQLCLELIISKNIYIFLLLQVPNFRQRSRQLPLLYVTKY